MGTNGRTNNIFCWLKEITEFKTPAKEFTDKDWDNFNAYMIHRFISTNESYTELANYAQTLMPNMKKDIYNFYKEMIPKRKGYFKYIKKKSMFAPNKDLVDKVASYFKVGSAEASSYIEILNKDDLTAILKEMGGEDKEIKKLLK